MIAFIFRILDKYGRWSLNELIHPDINKHSYDKETNEVRTGLVLL